ncbi:MAG: hypothetical protein NTW75_00660 [Planctomycetales bacterium]|nr:hypothetical protein [Planctomycetales bacterium]
MALRKCFGRGMGLDRISDHGQSIIQVGTEQVADQGVCDVSFSTRMLAPATGMLHGDGTVVHA